MAETRAILTQSEKDIAILIVEDDTMSRTFLRRILKEEGFTNISAVQDGLEAQKEITKHRYDVVLLDLQLPGLDGVEVLKLLRQRHARARVMVITSSNERHVVEQVLEAGAQDYLVKPFAPSVVIERLVRLIRHKGDAKSE
ncbi:MAG: response regulator [Bdellovibrionales bacterium]|nr:response regulator [Bdellovibrionales bacterium]